MGRIIHENVEKPSMTTRSKRKTSEKGKIRPETERVTHSCSATTSKMTSRQEVDRVTKRKTKAKERKASNDAYSASSRLKEMCSKYLSSMDLKESPTKSPEKETKDQETRPESEQGLTFEFSKRLIALAQERQAESRKRKRSESKTFSRKRKSSGSQDDSNLKRKHQKLSQSASSSEDQNATFEKMIDHEKKLMNEKEMKIENPKRWSIAAPMDFEFSRRLTELSRKRSQRYQHDEHAHCCRCVQSFECFWPRSNLQTIRRQGYF